MYIGDQLCSELKSVKLLLEANVKLYKTVLDNKVNDSKTKYHPWKINIKFYLQRLLGKVCAW